MEIKVRYKSFDQFFRLNKDDFRQVQNARKEMKSLQELGMSGNALAEAERLGYRYLNLKCLVSDLLFGVTGSVLDAKHDIKNQTGLAFRKLKGSAAERNKLLECEASVVASHQTYNDLHDLEEVLKNKRDDFESCHYYYKQLSSPKN